MNEQTICNNYSDVVTQLTKAWDEFVQKCTDKEQKDYKPIQQFFCMWINDNEYDKDGRRTIMTWSHTYDFMNDKKHDVSEMLFDFFKYVSGFDDHGIKVVFPCIFNPTLHIK